MMKLTFDLIFENMTPGGHDLLTPESTSDMPVNQVAWSHGKNVLRKWSKNSKIPNFDLFFTIKNP